MRIVNIGSLNIDYVYDLDAFVRKGQTIASRARSVFAGGKGLNQSLALGRAGVDVRHAGLIGPEGMFLRDLLSRSGVDVRFVREFRGEPTGHAIIQRDAEGDNCIILFGGANQHLDEAFVDEVLADGGAGDWLLLQNETSSVAYAMSVAKRKGMHIAFNPSPITDELCTYPLDLVDSFILNEGEAACLVGGFYGDATTMDGAPALLEAVHHRFPGAEIVLTLGECGSLYRHGDEVVECPALAVNVVDTTAAGDTFTGYFLAERMHGADAGMALRVATAAAALAVSRSGAAPSIPLRDEVEALLAERWHDAVADGDMG